MADTAALDAAPIAAALPTSRDDKALHRLIFVGIAVLLVVAPLVLYPVYLMKVLCFALFALAFNLLLGYGGLLSFGHAAYFGLGGYAAGYSAKAWGFTPEVAILFGTLAGGLLGTVFGWLAIRRQGIYFAMTTLALAQMIYFYYLQAAFTGGEIVGEFLMSIGYLPGAHHRKCPVHRRLERVKPPWMHTGAFKY